jgi:pimeloyl-ACP methyl ester carboxylesterase
MKKLSALLFIVFATALADGADDHKNHKAAPLFAGLGNHHHPVATKSDLAQKYFDQGLIFAYAFNHAEAIRSFREAARLDPTCAMAYWGVAFALGPNINATMSEEAAREAYQAVQKAIELSPQASERDRAYIAALARRYVKEPTPDRKALDLAYADAMRELARRYPKDSDALTLFAESLMDTMPWDYWTKDGKAKPATLEIIAALEAAIALDPTNPGAHHFYIHAMEASPTPERALASADRLRDLVPGAGHLVHMPAHIYMRVGRYHDATLANERAVESDGIYHTQCHAMGGIYQVAYVPHNHHFLWASATMEGDSAKALKAARYMAANVDRKLIREPGYGTIQHYVITPLYALVRFAKWDEILKEPAPDGDLLYPTAVWNYARGMAFAKKKRFDEAQRELESLSRIAQDKTLESVTIWDINTTAALVRVAREVLAGELAFERGDIEQAVRRLEEAARLEGELRYDEPAPWHYPVRQSLGGVLLAAGRAEEAGKVFAEDLKRNPENGWSLYGLSLSLKAQGEKRAAQEARARFEKAWAYADINLDEAWPWRSTGKEFRKAGKKHKKESAGEMPAIKSIRLSAQVTLEYAEQGDERGVPVILLHGYTDSLHSFDLVMPHLPRRFRVLALSQRGHGDSSRPATYRPQDFAADVATFMDGLKIESAVIVGHSMGGYVAQRFAIDYPNRTKGLVIAGSFTTYKGNPEVLSMREALASVALDAIDRDFARDFQVSTISRPVPEKFLEMVIDESAKIPARVWKSALEAFLEDDSSGELGRIKAPTLIVWGDRDSIVLRKEQDTLASRIAGARLVIYSGTGHALHWEEPERFASDLATFIESLDASGKK